MNAFTVLGIETSCDETAAAVLRFSEDAPFKAEILSNVIYSQFDEHAAYGGVVPEIAARAHAEKLPPILQKALNDANLTIKDISLITAATGPGLVGALLMGSTFAKTLALGAQKPFIPTNHIEGHALTALLTEDTLKPPYLLLLASGGHCQIVHVEDVGYYTTLGATLDDAAGECFDKVGKMLGFTHPYAPKVEDTATKGDATAYAFPKPKTADELDFSFSGLKTAVLNAINKEAQKNTLTDQTKANIAASFQHVVATSLAEKASAALQRTGAIPLVVSGGVAVNKTIRSALKAVAEAHNVPFYAPPIQLCTDNAVMIAYTAGLRALHTSTPEKLQNIAFKVRPRWPLEEMSLPTSTE